MLNVSSITKTSVRALYFVMGLSLVLAYAVPQAGSFESRGNTSSAKWVSQAPVSGVSGGASIVNADAGDVLNFALTIQNTSSTDVFYSADALLDEPAPYVGAHELRVGATNDTVYSFFDYSYGTYVNNNRYATFETGDPVYRNQNLTFNWSMRLASGLADGTYRYRVGVVQEYDAWLGDAPGPGAGGPNNNLGGRTGGTIFWDIVVGAGGTPTTSGALTISSSSQTPAATQVADNGNANFTRFTLTAAPGTTASISSIYVTRDGLSTDSEVENVKLLDANMVQVGNTAGGFNANHQAQLFFSPSLMVTGSQDFIIRAGIVDASTANHTVRLGVASASDIISNASSVTGPPVYGNYMTIINVTLGLLTLDEDGSVTDGTPDVGETDVVLNTFKLTAGTTEDIIIEQITVNKAGSADASDTTNIELWDVTHNVSLGTVANWSNSDKAVFPVSMTLTQGQVLRLRIQADIVDGSGLTVNADLVDGSDVLVFAKGALYGFYITPTCATTTNWTLDSGTGGTNNKGQGDKNQTINAGSLNISKSTSTIPTGNIAQAADQVLGTWNFEARGEPIRISALSITLAGTAGDTDAEDIANFKSVKLYDENGNIVAGPTDATAGDAAGTAGDAAVDFSQTFVVPVGIHPYTLKANIQTGAANGETVIPSINAAGDITAKTIRTNTTVTATGPTSTLNTQTVQAAALVSTTLATPVARSIVPGTSEFTFMTGKYDASSSGEDVLITAQQFSLATGTGADVDLLLDITIWADIDGNGTFETQLSSPETNSGNALAADIDDTITYDKHTLTVPKGTFVNIAYVASVSASAGTDDNDAGDKFTISFDGDASDVTASGKDTGTAITTAPTGTGPVITVTANGTLTITLDSSTPLASLIVGGSQKFHATTWRFAADNVEDIRIDDISIEHGSTATDDMTKLYLYANRDNTGALVTPYEIGSTVITAIDTIVYMNPNTSLRPVVPANNYVLVYAYLDVATVDGTAVVNGDSVRLNIDDVSADINVTGMGSGSSFDPSGTDGRDGNIHQLYKSIPTVTLAPTSPSGNLILSTTTEIARFRITADAADDITFDDGAYSTLSVQITAYNTDFADGSTSVVTLKNMSNGLTIASPVAADIGSTAAAKTTQVDFTFEDNGTFTVPAGDYRDVGVIADVTLFEDAGDSIVAWLSDDAATDFGWAINSATVQGTTAGTADISFRGDIYGNTLVKAG